MRGKDHSPEVRAAVVAALVTGASVSDVCAEFDVPLRTAHQWREAALKTSKLIRYTGDESRVRRELDLEQLVGDLVTASIASLVAQSGLAAERDWFTAQSAEGVAEYRGVEFDRLLRLLRAFQRPQTEPGTAIEGAVIETAH